MNLIAKIISVVFQPLFVPVYTLILLLTSSTFFFPPVYKLLLTLAFFSSTCFFPFLFCVSIFSLKSLVKLGRKERNSIYAVTFITYVFCFYILWKMYLPFALLVMFGGCVFAVFLLLVINFFWKISAHATVMGCCCGYIFLFALYASQNPIILFCISILLAGVVGWARLYLKAHTAGQVFAGYAVGLLPSLLSIVLFV